MPESAAEVSLMPCGTGLDANLVNDPAVTALPFSQNTVHTSGGFYLKKSMLHLQNPLQAVLLLLK